MKRPRPCFDSPSANWLRVLYHRDISFVVVDKHICPVIIFDAKIFGHYFKPGVLAPIWIIELHVSILASDGNCHLVKLRIKRYVPLFCRS